MKTLPRALLVMASFAVLPVVATAQVSYWPPTFTVDSIVCGTSATARLTVGGNWYCPAVPTGAHGIVGDNAVTLVVEWNFTSPPPCAAVITPWSRTVDLLGLTIGGHYQVNAVFAGPLALAPASIGEFIVVCPCAADLDNDGDFADGGHPDGGVDVNDLLYFLVGFEAGNVAVDLDDGSGQGTRDGGVDINDLLYFLAHFEAGC